MIIFLLYIYNLAVESNSGRRRGRWCERRGRMYKSVNKSKSMLVRVKSMHWKDNSKINIKTAGKPLKQVEEKRTILFQICIYFLH